MLERERRKADENDRGGAGTGQRKDSVADEVEYTPHVLRHVTYSFKCRLAFYSSSPEKQFGDASTMQCSDVAACEAPHIYYDFLGGREFFSGDAGG